MEQEKAGRQEVFIKEEMIIRQKQEQRGASLNIQLALKSFTAHGGIFYSCWS